MRLVCSAWKCECDGEWRMAMAMMTADGGWKRTMANSKCSANFNWPGHSFIPLFSFICMSFASPRIRVALPLSLAHFVCRPGWLAGSFSCASSALGFSRCFSRLLYGCTGHVCLPGCQLLMAVMCIINMHCTAPHAALYFASVFLLLSSAGITNWLSWLQDSRQSSIPGYMSAESAQLFMDLVVLLRSLASTSVCRNLAHYGK